MNTLITTEPIHLWTSILIDGIGQAGLTMSLTIKRRSDSYYWNGTAWASSSSVLSATDGSNGYYYYNISTYATFFASGYESGYDVRFYDGATVNNVEWYYTTTALAKEAMLTDVKTSTDEQKKLNNNKHAIIFESPAYYLCVYDDDGITPYKKYHLFNFDEEEIGNLTGTVTPSIRGANEA